MIPCNCTTRCCQCACSPGAPLDTTCMTVQAQDVLEGDYLDTRGATSAAGFIARVVTPPHAVRTDRPLTCVLNVEGQRAARYRKTAKVKVWRDSRVAAPRPLDLRTDRPYRNLSEVARAGRAGLNDTFPLGSLWEVGPFQPNVDPEVVRIINKNQQGTAFTSGVNYSHAPEDAEALGKKCWFVNTETVYSPWDARKQDNGHPAHVLAPLTPRMAAKLGLACCDCAAYVPPCQQRVLSCNAGVVQSMRAAADSLRATITNQQAEINRLGDKLAGTQLRANVAERKLAAIKAQF